MTSKSIDGFRIRTDLAYDIEAHLWIGMPQDGVARIGVDPLGVETFGTLATISLSNPPLDLSRGVQFGSMEAEKFVGSLLSPLVGRLIRRNEQILTDPGVVERDPYGDGWLIEVETTQDPKDLAYIVFGEDAVTEAFEKRIAAYRLEGVLAE